MAPGTPTRPRSRPQPLIGVGGGVSAPFIPRSRCWRGWRARAHGGCARRAPGAGTSGRARARAPVLPAHERSWARPGRGGDRTRGAGSAPPSVPWPSDAAPRPPELGELVGLERHLHGHGLLAKLLGLVPRRRDVGEGAFVAGTERCGPALELEDLPHLGRSGVGHAEPPSCGVVAAAACARAWWSSRSWSPLSARSSPSASSSSTCAWPFACV